MSTAPIPATDAEPTTVDEIEHALRVITKVIDEINESEPGVKKAIVVSSLYRALQERTKEVREMREIALLDAAYELAQVQNEWRGDSDPGIRYFEPAPDDDSEYRFLTLAHNMKPGIDALMYKVNPTFVIERANGKREVLDPFTSEYEPMKIADRLYRRVVKTLKNQRQWEAKYGRPYPHPDYKRYENK